MTSTPPAAMPLETARLNLRQPAGRDAVAIMAIARDHRGRGFATEAAQAIARVGLETFGYRKLTSGYYADNPASGRVLAKLGFTVVGASNRPCLAEGKDKPSVEVEYVPGLRDR